MVNIYLNKLKLVFVYLRNFFLPLMLTGLLQYTEIFTSKICLRYYISKCTVSGKLKCKNISHDEVQLFMVNILSIHKDSNHEVVPTNQTLKSP